MISNKEIRARARKMLGDNIFANAWIFALLVTALLGVVIGFLSSVAVGFCVKGGGFNLTPDFSGGIIVL